MIKQTFYNLTKEKKRRILEAAKTEFSKVPLHDAKISNIVNTAEIPRGSFYQYFNTLNDVFIAMMQDIEQEKIAVLDRLVHETTGDVFELAILMFENEYEYFKGMDNMLLTNIFKLSEIEVINFEEMKDKFKDTRNMSFLNHLDFSRFKNTDEKEILLIIQMIFTLLSETVRTSIVNGFSIKDAEELLIRKLNYLKYGILNRDEEKE